MNTFSSSSLLSLPEICVFSEIFPRICDNTVKIKLNLEKYTLNQVSKKVLYSSCLGKLKDLKRSNSLFTQRKDEVNIS